MLAAIRNVFLGMEYVHDLSGVRAIHTKRHIYCKYVLLLYAAHTEVIHGHQFSFLFIRTDRCRCANSTTRLLALR